MIKLRIRRDEEGRIITHEAGSALVLALVFLSFIGLAIAAIMGFADAGLRNSLAVQEQGAEVAAAEGAMGEAIAWLRSQLTEGRFGGTCPNFISKTTLPQGGVVTATVLCEGAPGSGGLPSGYVPNRPEQAILTTATDTVKGYEQKSNNVLGIQGDVWSNSSIDTDAGASSALVVEGIVRARDACEGTIQAALVLCNTGLLRPDPNYPMATSVVPPLALIPNCALFPSVVEMNPGTYLDAIVLSAITNPSGGSPCAGKVIWFPPGVYYFDFVNAGSHTWLINTGSRDGAADVTGGTPYSNTGPLAPPIVPAPFPGSCKVDDNPASPLPGVQFIFGGDSQLNVQGGETEICAPALPGQQQIAIFGVTATTGGVPAPVAVPFSPTGASSVASANESAYAPAGNALVIDGALTADAPLSALLPTARIVLSGICSVCLPPGSAIQTVTLELAHREPVSGASRVGNVTATAEFQGAGSPIVISDAGTTPGCNIATSLCRHNGLATDTIDLLALGLDTVEELNGGVTVTYSSRREAGTPTDRIDGARIVVTYVTPTSGFRRQMGPLISGDTAPVLQTGGPNTGLAIHGTLYTPLSGLDIFLNNASLEFVDRGLIARYMKVHLTASSSPGIAVSVPSEPRSDRFVVLSVMVDDGTSQRLRLRVLVHFDDECVPSPCSPGERVTVSSWSVIR